jgi:predicted TIM-barrel enzyme
MLKISDGCIVGTWLKVDGKFFNKVDKARVEELMANAKAFRGDL